MGKPRDGKEVKKPYTAKVEPLTGKAIIGIFGSFTNFVNTKIKNDKLLTKKIKELEKAKGVK